jgi:hypothetical protein
MSEPTLEKQFAGFGDYEATPWTDAQAHGTIADRAHSFASGWRHEPFGTRIANITPTTIAPA